jgi:hypothetical protein
MSLVGECRARRARWLRGAALGGLLVALALAPALALSPAAVAARKSAAPRPVRVADSGFRPGASGFAFPNYGNVPGVPNLGSDELRQLFGDSVCAGFAAGVCVLSPPALAWMQQENLAMGDGHCFGLSVAALFFHAHLSAPARFGATRVPQLKLGGNQMLAREIAYGYVFQYLDSVRRAEVAGAPHEILTRLESALRSGSELYTLGFTQPDGTAGHAITPFAVKRLSPERYAILAYDNNYPNSTRVLSVDLASDSWTYSGATTPDQSDALYSGNASTRTLFLLPTRPGLGVQPCPFCAPPGGAVIASARSPSTRAPSTYESVHLSSVTPFAGHLVITDSRGRRLGVIRGRLVDQIPGARIVTFSVGTPRTWLSRLDPEYRLPSGRRYRIEVVSDLRRGRRLARTTRASVTAIEPGFVAAVRNVAVAPGQRAELTLASTGRAVTFRAIGGGRQTPEIVLGNAHPGTVDREWNISSRGVPAGRSLMASMDPATTRMSIAGTGTYDLTMDSLGNTVQVFTHPDVQVAGGMTTAFDYGTWTEGALMPTVVTEGGQVVSQQGLTDQPNGTDTGAQFDPTEPSPPPAEPQPAQPSSAATSTSLVCTPAVVAVGEPTTCSVAVTDMSSEATDMPTGTVAFDADGSGAFSTPSCTVSGGSCEVVYVPSDVGSGQRQITAAYDGDDAHNASQDTATVTVTQRSTSTAIACDPGQVAAGETMTCSATVADQSAGTPVTPTGTVTLASQTTGTFDGNPCTLAGSGDSASCTVTFTPDADTTTTDQIAAAYSGDDVHAGGSSG